jgi:hypothetical protein
MGLNKTLVGIIGVIVISCGMGCATYKPIINDDDLPFANPKVSAYENYGYNSYENGDGSADENADIYSNMSWQKAIKYVKTPRQVEDYLKRHFSYDPEPTFYIPGFITIGKQKGESFKYLHTKRIGSCFNYATVAAALLSDDGYPPLILDMRQDEDNGHSVFLYRTKDGYCCIGNGSVDTPQPTISQLIHECEKQFTDGSKMKYYNVINLDNEYPNKSWIDGDMNLIMKMPDQ